MSRFAIAALAVAVWMALGWLIELDANQYLLLGVPLTLAFQRLVARRPLHALWVRDAARFQLGRMGAVLAVLLAATPIYALARLLISGPREPSAIMWLVCAIAGAAAAAFAIVEARSAAWRALFGCLATAGAIGVALMIAAWLARGTGARPNVLVGIKWLLLYLPVTFVLEEVFFRGALDSYVHRPGDAHGWLTAFCVSALWGLWHLPLTPGVSAASVVSILVVHTAVGVPMSIYWRRGGNLLGPAVTHAFVDGVRNGLLG